MAGIIKRRDRYYVRWVDVEGKRHERAAGANRTIAKQVLREIEDDCERERDGRPRYGEQARSPIKIHLDAFEVSLRAKDVTAQHVGETINRLNRLKDALNAKTLANFIDSDRIQAALAGWREPKQNDEGETIDGLSIASSNRYIASVKAFGSWLYTAKRWPENPFYRGRLPTLNEQTDRRLERRALDAEELGKLLAAAEGSRVDVLGLDGRERAALYLTAARTGLRVGELPAFACTISISKPAQCGSWRRPRRAGRKACSRSVRM